MSPLVLAFGCVIFALVCLRISNACKRTVEMTKDWPGEKQAKNRAMATLASKILRVAAIVIAVGGVIGAIVLAVMK